MSLFPLERIETLMPGQPIRAELLNRMQDGTVRTAKALRTMGMTAVLSNRQNVAGAWTIGNAGQLTESASGSSCRVFFQCFAPCRLLGVTVVGRQDTTATSQFTCNLVELSGTGTVTTLGVTATSDGVTTGADQMITSSIANGGYITVVGRRYAVLLGTTGAGATQRSLLSATVLFDLLL
jgi:hypothetical protein